MKKLGFLLLAAAIFSICYLAFKQAPVVVWLPLGDIDVEVPYVPTPMEVVDEMLAMANVGPADLLYDLGSGDGRIVITAAQKWGTRGVGVEIDPELVRESRKNAEQAQVADLVEFIQADLFKVDLGKATVVTLYLLPDLNLRLRPILLNTLPAGTRIVSHSWDMGEWEADETRAVPSYLEWFSAEATRFSIVHFWVIPANVSGVWQWPERGGNSNQGQLCITQHFQKAAGTFLGQAGTTPAVVEITGDRVRIRLEETAKGKNLWAEYQGRAAGDAIEGTVTFSDGSRQPWKATRRPGTLTALDRLSTQGGNGEPR
jgi:hypothetical protein